MSRILMGWEMGANMGHIDRMLNVAHPLRRRGHEMHFVLRDLSRAHPRVAAAGFRMGQAPVWLPRMANPPRLGNYAAVLAAAGWLDATGLAGLVSAWWAWYDALQPDLLIADHAPTAVLAARCRGLPVCCIGNSFEVPPQAEYFPQMAHWTPTPPGLDREQDSLLLQSTNQALALLGQPPLARLTDLFATARRAIASLPELAHYEGYGEGDLFAGPSYVSDLGNPPQWPAGEAGCPRVFAYLSPTHDEFRPLMAALKELGYVALVHAKGISAEAAARLGGPRLRIEPQPLRMEAVLQGADIVVSHASLGTVTAALLAGKPQLGIPNHMEQHMMARRILSNGIGLAVEPRTTGHPWRDLLRRLADEPTFAANARALAARHAGLRPGHTGERLADLVEASLQPPPEGVES